MKLSILIPSIPSRFVKMQTLYRKLELQIKECKAEKEVEILCLIDNKNRSIGQKRDDLVQLANGKYLAFVDDDDDISGSYIKEMLKGCEAGKDLICFRQLATEITKTSSMWSYVEFSLFHPKNEEFKNHYHTKRKPFHICGVRSEYAKQERFKDVGYGEDWEWMSRVLVHCETEYKTMEVIHFYTYDVRSSEAPIESNPIFINKDLEFQKKKKL